MNEIREVIAVYDEPIHFKNMEELPKVRYESQRRAMRTLSKLFTDVNLKPNFPYIIEWADETIVESLTGVGFVFLPLCYVSELQIKKVEV